MTRPDWHGYMISLVLAGAVNVSIAELGLPPCLGVPAMLLSGCLIGATLGALLYPVR